MRKDCGLRRTAVYSASNMREWTNVFKDISDSQREEFQLLLGPLRCSTILEQQEAVFVWGIITFGIKIEYKIKRKTISLFCLHSLELIHLLQEEAALVNQTVQGILMRPTLQSTSHNSNVLLN